MLASEGLPVGDGLELVLRVRPAQTRTHSGLARSPRGQPHRWSGHDAERHNKCALGGLKAPEHMRLQGRFVPGFVPGPELGS